MLFSNPFKARLPLKAEALPGRSAPIFDGGAHCVLGTPTTGPFPDHLETVQLGLGCFWGAERLFWKSAQLKDAARIAARRRDKLRHRKGGPPGQPEASSARKAMREAEHVLLVHIRCAQPSSVHI